MNEIKHIYVTGVGGYVGALLAPALLDAGYKVTGLDLFLYGENVLDAVRDHPGLTLIKGDLRDAKLLKETIPGADAVIHLACISNDPSYELDLGLGKSINYDAFMPLVDISKAAGVKRFIYASSSSVYGIKKGVEVTEELPLDPLTDYSKYKALCEGELTARGSDDFTTIIIRPSTLCGYSPRQRLDLTVNILTNHALNKGRITVYGGEQIRPNLHVKDMVALYLFMLRQDSAKVHQGIYNVGYQNHKVKDIAHIVRRALGEEIEIETTPSDDLRSYHVNSDKIARELGFVPGRTIEDAVRDLKEAFDQGLLPNSMDDIRYSNIKTMQAVGLV